MRAARRVAMLVATAGLLSLGGCVKQQGTTSLVPGMDEPAPGPAEEPEEVEGCTTAKECKAMLDARVEKRSTLATDAEKDAKICEDLCSLATSICVIAEKQCELADDNPGDNEYRGLCREAQQECRESQESCVHCVELSGRNQSRPPKSE